MPDAIGLMTLLHWRTWLGQVAALLHMSEEKLEHWLEHPDEMPAYEMRRIQACFELGLVPTGNGIAVH